MKNVRKMRGITLVALIVTIIILLILAGISLQLIGGSNGILNRASSALEQNKIAMAKEQVELALSDFLAEFLEAKYVDRTNDGNKKEYITQKLLSGVTTTNYYAQASNDGNVMVYEGKDNTGAEVIKGVLQEEASIKWEESLGESEGTKDEENGETTEEEKNENGNISAEEFENLKEVIAQLQGEVNGLKAQQQMTNQTLDSILTSQTRKDVIYSGFAKEKKTYNFTFPSGKNLSSYKMLIFFADAYYKELGSITKQTAMTTSEVSVSPMTYCFTYTTVMDANNYWNLHFSIPNVNQFRIDEIFCGSYIDFVRIYEVIGIY